MSWLRAVQRARGQLPYDCPSKQSGNGTYQAETHGLKEEENMRRQLGVNQKGVIRAMLSRNGTWYAGCGWLYDTHSGTTRIMESLVKRGDARKEEIREGSGEYMYTLTEKWLSAKV